MLTLALDTATPRSSCALVRDGELLDERESRAIAVLAVAEELLAENGLVPGDLDRIVCGPDLAAAQMDCETVAGAGAAVCRGKDERARVNDGLSASKW